MAAHGHSFIQFISNSRALPQPVDSVETAVGTFLRYSGARLSSRHREQVETLRQERDPTVFFQGFLNLGRDLLVQDEVESAGAVFSILSQEPAAENFRDQARRELGAASGKGALGDRLAFQIRYLTGYVSDWKNIAPMVGASMLGRWIGASLGVRLLEHPAAMWTRGPGLRLASGSAGLTAEISAFLSLEQLLLPSARAFGGDWQAAAIGLTTFRLSNAIGQGLTRRLPGLDTFRISTRISPTVRATQFLVPQLSIFFGMWAARAVQESGGLRPQSEEGSAPAEILGAMLSFAVGNELSRRFLGPGFARLDRELSLREGFRSIPGLPTLIPPKWGETAMVSQGPAYPTRPSLRPKAIPMGWTLNEGRPGGVGGLAAKPTAVQLPKGSVEELARAKSINEKILLGDRQVLRQEEVLYFIEEESMGGNTPSGIIAVNLYVDPATGQIRAVGNDPNIPPSVAEIYKEITFWIRVIPENRHELRTPFIATIQRLFTYGNLHEDVVAELGKLVGSEYERPSRDHYPKKYRR